LNLSAEIKRESERCVACGLCLPLCPTYRLTRDEAESPRGRISLMRALVTQELPATAHLVAHLDRCLICRACEKACPSNVAYGELFDHTRAWLSEHHPSLVRRGIFYRLFLNALTGNPGQTGWLEKFLRFYRRSGLAWMAGIVGLSRVSALARLGAGLPQTTSPPTAWKSFYPASGTKRGRIGLFTGCASSISDRDTLAASIRLLSRLGYDINVPATQGCCGALHLHDGEQDRARELMRRNIEAFAPGRHDAVLGVASGCVATLCEYGKTCPEPGAPAFAGRVQDINTFLAGIEWDDTTHFRPLAKRVALHMPCTLTQVLRQPDTVHRLLKKIPGIELEVLAENYLCCGAAGTYMLTQPEMAQRLLADKVAHLKHLSPDILVTANVGCALHLAAGIREAGLNIEILHPAALLERQIRDKT
jgi:glycolate oxidase iron-sulfur subunit